MSMLQVYEGNDMTNLLFATNNKTKIAASLAEVGVRYEQWLTDSGLQPGASQEAVIAAYQKDIDRLIDSDGYQAVDVVSMNPTHPQTDEFRQKFLSEHTHSEDEVRFFVAGQGLFSLHIGENVYEVLFMLTTSTA